MSTTLPHELETIDPSETNIIVRVVPTSVSDVALTELREIAKSRATASDCLRTWLRGCADAEIARRAEGSELEEPEAWRVPWHKWNDRQLAAALACSYSWFQVETEADTNALLREVHRALLTACCTRLQELHTAIENSRRNRG